MLSVGEAADSALFTYPPSAHNPSPTRTNTHTLECGVDDAQVSNVLQSKRSVASIGTYRRDDNSIQSVEMDGM